MSLPAPFKFVQADHPSLVQVSDDRLQAVRTSAGASESAAIVYVDQPLEVGNELVFIVESAHHSGRESVSLTLGLTTCCVRKIQKYECHADSLCHKNGPCEGQSTTIQLKKCSFKGARIILRRIANNRQITVRVGNYCGAISGMNFRTVGRVFPFLVLTGDVTGVQIGADSIRRSYVSPYLEPQNGVVNGNAVAPVGAAGDEGATVAAGTSGYAFLLPGRPTRKEPGKIRTYVRCNMHGVSNKLIFLTQELRPDSPLVLKVIENRAPEREFSFIFGITTCDRTSFSAKFLHHFVWDDPSTCIGHSKYCKIPPISAGGNITIERTNDPFIRFTVGTTAYQLEDDECIFTDKRVFPFVMLTGTAKAMSIFGSNLSDKRTSRRSAIFHNQEHLIQSNPGGYEFMVMHENGSMEPQKAVSSRIRGIRMKMTFFSKELAVGDPLFIRVIQKKVEQDISFTFGVTKCNRTSRDLPFEHIFNFQKPSTCKGHEIHCEVPSQPVNAVISFERNDYDFIKIQTPKETFLLRDRTGIFDNCKAYPYVMVNGSAYALEILNQNEVPQHFLRSNEATSFMQSSCNSEVADDVINNHEDWSGSSTPSNFEDEILHQELADAPLIEENHSSVTASTPNSKLSTRKWFNNVTITYKNSKLFRFGDANKISTVLSDKFPSGDFLSFRVTQIDTRFTGSVTFGVTTLPLVMIDVDEIPEKSDDKWFVASNIMPVICFDDEFQIRRTDSDVRLESRGKETDSCLFQIPSGMKVSPFFRFDGAIRELLMID